MKAAALTASLLLSASGALAQGGGRVGGPIGGGFGNVVFPGTGIPGAGSATAGHIPALSQTIRGVPPQGRPGGGGGRGAIIYPVVVGTIPYGYGYEQQPQPAPNVTVVNAPPTSPTVIINQGYVPDQARPVVREYSEGSAPTADPSSYQAPIPSNAEPARTESPRVRTARSVNSEKANIYLLAMKDGSVYSTYALWLEGDTVHYVTTKHAMNMASVSLVDVPVTRQLNEERGLEVKLGAN